MKFSATVDTKALEAALKQLGGKATQSALNSALNRGGSAMQTSASKLIRETYAVKAGVLKSDALRLDKARGLKHWVELRISGKRLSLLGFGKASQSRRGKGTSVTVRRGTRTLFPHAFLATMRYGPAVFWRTMVGGRRVGRGPVEALSGPSAAQMLGGDRAAKVMDAGLTTFRQRFQHELNRAIARKG